MGPPNWFDARQSYAETISVTSAMCFLRDINICCSCDAIFVTGNIVTHLESSNRKQMRFTRFLILVPAATQKSAKNVGNNDEGHTITQCVALRIMCSNLGLCVCVHRSCVSSAFSRSTSYPGTRPLPLEVLFSSIPKFEPPWPSNVADPNSEVAVNIRIEGRTMTLFEGTIRTKGRTVTTTDGTHVTGRADGTNGNEYPFPVPTCTAALADAATGQDGRPVWGG